MRRKGFRVALRGLRDSLRFAADVHLATASAAAAKMLAQITSRECEWADAATPEQVRAVDAQMSSLTSLLRLAHLRSRFSADAPEPPASAGFPKEVHAVVNEIYGMCSTSMHENTTLGEACELFKRMGRDPHAWLEGAKEKNAATIPPASAGISGSELACRSKNGKKFDQSPNPKPKLQRTMNSSSPSFSAVNPWINVAPILTPHMFTAASKRIEPIATAFISIGESVSR